MGDQPTRDERTEEATPRRRQEAREKGQVALSTEFVSAAMLISGLLFLVLGGRLLLAEAGGLVVDGIGSLRVLGLEPLDAHETGQVMGDAVKRVLPPFLIVIVPTLVVGAAVAFGQTGIGVAAKAVEVDLSKIDPAKGVGRLFSLRSVVRTIMSLAKISVIVVTILAVAWTQLPRLSALVGIEVGPATVALWGLLLRCAVAALIAVLLLGLVDFAYQRFQHERDLMMTKQEVRDENKNTDGDPHVKARIRRVQREMAQRRMMQEIPSATVVVTNPTHYAVALRYAREPEGAGGEPPGGEGRDRRAPVVVAKGADHVARRIKEVAHEHGVICFEDVILARALHARVEIGQEIPEDLYEAVASVLAYVYRVKGAAAPA